MREEQPIVLVLPRFTPWMKRLSILVVAVWLAEVLLLRLAPRVGEALLAWLSLRGGSVVPGLQLWRVATYPWLEEPNRFGALWTVLALWLIGAPVERAEGTRRIAELLVVGVVGGAVAALIASQLSPTLRWEPVVGLAGFTSALLAALGFLYADQQLTFFGLGPMRGKHLVLGLGALSVLMALMSRSASGAVTIGGLFAGAGWMWWRRRRASGPGTARAGRARKTSGSRFRVVPGGRSDADRHSLN